MGTRSYIALQIEEDEYLTIFCHYNGYALIILSRIRHVDFLKRGTGGVIPLQARLQLFFRQEEIVKSGMCGNISSACYYSEFFPKGEFEF